MPNHDVSMKIDHLIPVGNVDVEFEVRVDGSLLGRAKISRGGIDWWPSNARAARSISWQDFAATMLNRT
jgi:hypothetical protein